MPVPVQDRELAARVAPPPSVEVRRAAHDYIERTDSSATEFAERVGYARHTMLLFLRGHYKRVASDDLYVRAAVWDFLQRNPIAPRAEARGRLFETAGYRQIRRYFLRAVEHGEIALLYGPPGVQKTFVLEHLICERHREKKSDAIYVYASVGMTILSLLKCIREAAGVVAFSGSRHGIISGLRNRFRQLASEGQHPPAIIVDEAQHLSVDCLETLRELHDEAACGLVLAGSHTLFESFVRPERRPHLEQWLSRIDHREQLPGLLKDEVAEIAARELGNGQPAKLTEKQKALLLEGCRVEDVYARGADGKRAVRVYYSARRLVKSIGQLAEQMDAKKVS